jgi:type I restriction enzyme S subunit
MNKYQSYKQSGVEWIGEIPSNWSITKIKYTKKDSKNSFIDGDWIESKDLSDEGIRYITSGNIGEGKYKEQGSGYISEVTFKELNCTEIFEGDLIISRLFLPVGRSCILPNLNKRVITCVDNVVLRPKESFNKSYLNYQFNSNRYSEFTELISRGVTLTRISRGMLGNNSIVVPPLSEQDQIVQFLDEKTGLIDELISKKERKITLLKEQRTSLINQVVTKGLNPNVKMKDSGIEWIGEVPEHWLLISLHKLLQTNRLEFQDGNHGGEHPNPEEFIETGVPFIKPRDIQDGNVDWSKCDRLPFERCSRFRIGFSNNDDVLLVNRGGSIGKVCYVNDYNNEFPYFIINPQVTYLRGKNGLSSKYVYYITKSDVFRCGVDLILGHGSTFPFLGLSNMGDFQMVLPPQVEQQKIVEYLDSKTKEIDNLVDLEQRKIDLLKEYRQSLISEVVTGKVKVTN